MNIDLDNYEAFFLDYHEGKLTPQQVAGLMSFLEEHPELKEVFYEFEDISLAELEETGHAIRFEEKEDLKKEVTITKDEMDDLLAGSVEGILDEGQQGTLDELLNSDPAVRRHLDLYRKTIITADLSEVFEGKSALKGSVLINSANCAEYFSAAMDNELNPLEQQELERFLLTHPSMQRELELLRKTKLSPDHSIVYENKDDLKRRKRVGMAWWHIPAAAAGLALLMGLYFIFSKPPAQYNPIVKNTPAVNSADKVISPAEQISRNEVPVSEKTSAESVVSSGRTKPRKSTPGAPLQQKDKYREAPVQDDHSDLQSPVIVNNTVLPERKHHSIDHLASVNNEINERNDPADHDDLQKPVAMGYGSFRDAAIGKLKTSIMKDEVATHAEPTKISKWDVLSLALRGFRKVTGK
jgi:hypothetical protein